MSEDSEAYLYLTTIGHKTGKPHNIEIWFVEFEGRYYMVAEGGERAHWVRNIRSNPAVRFSVGTRSNRQAQRPLTQANGRIVLATGEPELAASVSQLMDDKYGWSDGLIVELAPLASV